MAWRIEESVVRGEIDNRARGHVTGRIWFVGRDEPVELDLAGDCWRDLAGRKLEFVNRTPKQPLSSSFAQRQSGVIGDCTASRKVRIPDVSIEELMSRSERGEAYPFHWGNSLYLEWFSALNGRVVIESADYELTIGPDIAWEMTKAEEALQQKSNSEALVNFMKILEAAVEQQKPEKPTDDDV